MKLEIKTKKYNKGNTRINKAMGIAFLLIGIIILILLEYGLFTFASSFESWWEEDYDSDYYYDENWEPPQKIGVACNDYCGYYIDSGSYEVEYRDWSSDYKCTCYDNNMNWKSETILDPSKIPEVPLVQNVPLEEIAVEYEEEDIEEKPKTEEELEEESRRKLDSSLLKEDSLFPLHDDSVKPNKMTQNEELVFRFINKIRKQEGLGIIEFDTKAHQMALAHAEYSIEDYEYLDMYPELKKYSLEENYPSGLFIKDVGVIIQPYDFVNYIRNPDVIGHSDFILCKNIDFGAIACEDGSCVLYFFSDSSLIGDCADIIMLGHETITLY
jgi:hypothetical protein